MNPKNMNLNMNQQNRNNQSFSNTHNPNNSNNNNNNNNNNNTNNNNNNNTNAHSHHSPYLSQSHQTMPSTAAAILRSGGSLSGAHQNNRIYNSAHGSVGHHRENSRHNRNGGNGNDGNFHNTYGGRYDGMIPLVRKFTLILIWIGIIVTAIAIFATIVLIEEYFSNDNKNDSDTKSKGNVIRNVRCVVIPLIVYMINAIICLIFYVEARRLQIHGYSSLYSKTSYISKINFRGSSAYFTIAFAAYAFLSNVCLFVCL